MPEDFAIDVTGWFFLAGAVMFWSGATFLPRRVGMFFESDDFHAIGAGVQLWLWLYRIHLFGMVVTALALVALAALLANQPAVRVLVWPGAAVAVAGLWKPVCKRPPCRSRVGCSGTLKIVAARCQWRCDRCWLLNVLGHDHGSPS